VKEKHSERATVNQASVHVCPSTFHSFEAHNEAASAKLLAIGWLIGTDLKNNNKLFYCANYVNLQILNKSKPKLLNHNHICIYWVIAFCVTNQIPNHEKLWEIGIMFHTFLASDETHPSLCIIQHCRPILLFRCNVIGVVTVVIFSNKSTVSIFELTKQKLYLFLPNMLHRNRRRQNNI
jgi:hypothetical protein